MALAWLHIAIKDLRVMLRDRQGWLLSLLLPILVTMVAGFALGGFGKDDGASKSIVIRFPVVNHDTGAIGQAVVKSLQEAPDFQVEIENSEDAARAKVSTGDRGAMLLIPAGFSERVMRGERVVLTVVQNPESQVTSLAVKQATVAIAQRVAGQNGVTHLLVNQMMGIAPQSDPVQLGSQMGDVLRTYWEGNPIGLQVESVAAAKKSDINPFGQYVPGFAVMFLLFTISKGAGSIIKERTSGTLQRVAMAPIRESDILFGKVLSNFLEGLMQISILIGIGWFVFGVSWGQSPGGLALLVITTTAAATALGLLMASVFRTTRQLDAVSTLIVLGMSALGGSWWPLEITPDWMQQLAKITITSWAMRGFHQLMWYEGSLSSVLPHITVLAIFSALFFSLALISLRVRTLHEL